MKKSLIVVSVLGGLALIGPQATDYSFAAQDYQLTHKNVAVDKDKAVDSYLAVVPVSLIMDDIARQAAEVLPKEQHVRFFSAMSKVSHRYVEQAVRDSLKRHFTTSEILALAKFYESRDGQQIMRKMPAYITETAIAIQSELVRYLVQ